MIEQNTAIKVENLTKKYGCRHVLNGISFYLKKGNFLSLIGSNGVGKTTLIRIIANITRPTTGEVYVNGKSTEKEGVKTRRELGILSHESFLYKDLNAYENLKFFGKLYRVNNIQSKIEKLLSLVELSSRKYDQVGTYSRGMEQRLSIARALIHDPKILILDEPYSGLDPHAKDILDRLIKEFENDNKTIIMTTHNIDKAYQFANRIIALTNEGIEIDDDAKNVKRERVAEIYKKEMMI